jgi:hypothetical protein
VIFVVILILVVTLIYGPTITFAGEEITGFPEGGVLEQPSTTPTPTPTPSPTLPPMQAGVLAPPPTLMESPSAGNFCELFPIHPSCKTPEQLQNDQPPLFSRNVPLQGFGVFGQQPAAIVPPSPVLTPVPPVLTPEPPVPMFGSTQEATPTPPPQFGQIAPQGQVPLTLGEETQEQPSEAQTTEEDEQVARDDDDGPVPPECPTTGPIPPDCTMKPKFPEERAIE